uniref:Folate receptor-like domain-containing protein n=1 Tax=Brassica campestris TaxID=3711 RepID=M4FHF8_BRACM
MDQNEIRESLEEEVSELNFPRSPRDSRPRAAAVAGSEAVNSSENALHLNLCNAFHGNTCCSSSLALQNLATHGEASKDCLYLFELLECSICHPDVGGPLRICASFCDSVFKACSDAYFSTSDSTNQVIVPCGARNGTYICEKASKLETNGTSFCEAVGFSVQAGDDSVEVPCYGSKRVLVTVVESFKKTVRLQDVKNKVVMINLQMCWSASVLALTITLVNMFASLSLPLLFLFQSLNIYFPFLNLALEFDNSGWFTSRRGMRED